MGTKMGVPLEMKIFLPIFSPFFIFIFFVCREMVGKMGVPLDMKNVLPFLSLNLVKNMGEWRNGRKNGKSIEHEKRGKWVWEGGRGEMVLGRV